MMQVSTLYAHSLERQFISKRSQIIQNISRSCAVEQQQHSKATMPQTIGDNTIHHSLESIKKDDQVLSEAGIIPELADGYSVCPPASSTLIQRMSDRSKSTEVDSKEFTDRLCKLPSQCRGGYILGAPRRHSIGPAVGIASRMCPSPGSVSPSLTRSPNRGKIDSKALNNLSGPEKKPEKKVKDKKKDARKMPSNFMLLGTWSMKQNCQKLLNQIRSGDVLEFNITLHHHWGVAIVPKNKNEKPPTLDTIEMVHLYKEEDGRQKVIKQTLAEYWTQGVTARINNSKDLHKQPLPAVDVASTALKLMTQPYKIWQNSEQMITYCRYGDGMKSKQEADAARWSSLSKCVGLWLSLTGSRQNSPTGSPTRRRKRTLSVNF